MRSNATPPDQSDSPPGQGWHPAASSIAIGVPFGRVRKERNEKARRSAQEVLAAKVEEHAEELVDLLMQAARRGEWRVVGLMLDRVFGKPKETIEQVNEEPEELQAMRAMSPEARRILLRQMNDAERQARSSSEH